MSATRSAQVVQMLQAKAEALRTQTEGLGPPCAKCRYGPKSSYSFDDRCRHPALSDVSYNLVTGKLTTRHEWRPGAARQAGSACGPDGFLFERKRIREYLWKAACHPAAFAFGIPLSIFSFIGLVEWLAF